MTFWSLTNSDFPTNQTFHQFHDLDTELDRHRIMSGFHGAFATGVASQQGTLTLPDTWFRPPFWDLLMLQLLRPNSSNLPCLYSTFHLEYPLVLSRFCFSVTSCLADMTLLKSQLRISFLFYVRLGHHLVKEIWVVHVWLWSHIKYHVTLKVTLTYRVNCKVNAYSFFIVWFVNSYLRQFLTKSLQIFKCGHWKMDFRLQRYYVIIIFKLRYLCYSL